MAFIARRFFSSTARLSNLKLSVANPAPVNATTALTTPELRALGEKAKGSWKSLTNEEKVMLYRATFPMTFKEMTQSTGDGMKVFMGVSVGVVIGIVLAQYLRKAVGPELPHTLGNAEWEENTRQKLLRQKANPIEGISSRVS